MGGVSSPEQVIDALEKLANDEASDAGLEFPLDDDTVKGICYEAMKASGIEGTYEEITANKALVKEYKTKLIGLKSQMAGYIKQVKDFEEETASSIQDVVTQISTATAEIATFNVGPPEDAAARGFCAKLAGDNATSSTSVAKNMKANFMASAKSLTGQASGILSAAASLNIGLPSAFLTAIETLSTVKSTVSKINIP